MENKGGKLMRENKIKMARKKLKLSVYDISRITGLSPTYISNLENNNRANPTKDKMDRIAEALNTTVPKLFY